VHVAAAIFTPASLIAAATCASAPGVFSTSMRISLPSDVYQGMRQPSEAQVAHLVAVGAGLQQYRQQDPV
jgi:hypothetical protein